MDPDGLSTIIILAGIATSFLLCFLLGALQEDEDNEENITILGFSDAQAGLALTAITAICLVVYCSISRFIAIWYWLIPIGIVYALLLVLVYAIGAELEFRKALPISLWRFAIGPIFTLPAKVLFRLLHLEVSAPVTHEQLMNMMDEVEEQDIIDESQKEMIANIVELDDVTAGDIMTHRTDLASVEAGESATTVIDLARTHGKSRIPVYNKTLDNIVGVIYVKDLLNLFGQNDIASTPAEALAHPAMFVPESCRAKELLIDFRRNHTQMAIVVDEYGGTAGIVTMEDVLEEIVGNIQDEYDDEEDELLAVDGGYVVAGSLDLEDVFDAFDLEIPIDDEDEYDSVGGLIIDKIGRIPEAGEHICISYAGIEFCVILAGERRIQKVRCTLESQKPAVETAVSDNTVPKTDEAETEASDE